MMRQVARIVVVSLLCVGLVSASGKALATDDTAEIVSLGGSVTEIVYALGQGHRLKARDTTSTFPTEAETLTDVGYLRALSPEGILSVDPSLILSEEGAGPPEVLAVIRAADVTFVEVADARDAAGIQRKILAVGKALDVPDRAEALSNDVGAALADAVARAEARAGERKRVLFILSLQGGRIMASGTGTAADAIIRMAGAENALADFEGYKQISDEAVGSSAPDVILMMDRGGDHGYPDDELFAMAPIRLTPAAETRSVVRMNGLLLLGMGPRTAEAVETLSLALYGDEG